MIAVLINESYDPQRGTAGAREAASKWWRISERLLKLEGDLLLAVANNIMVGVFDIVAWSRDDENDGKVVFDLLPSSRWGHLVGQPSPVTWGRHQANPVRKVNASTVLELASRRTAASSDDTSGWSLEVSEDGRQATVRAPATNIVLESLSGGTLIARTVSG